MVYQRIDPRGDTEGEYNTGPRTEYYIMRYPVIPRGRSKPLDSFLPCALPLATNCGLLDLLSEHPSCLMDSPAPPPGQVRLTQVGGGEIPVLNTMQNTENQSPSKGNEKNKTNETDAWQTGTHVAT